MQISNRFSFDSDNVATKFPDGSVEEDDEEEEEDEEKEEEEEEEEGVPIVGTESRARATA